MAFLDLQLISLPANLKWKTQEGGRKQERTKRSIYLFLEITQEEKEVGIVTNVNKNSICLDDFSEKWAFSPREGNFQHTRESNHILKPELLM